MSKKNMHSKLLCSISILFSFCLVNAQKGSIPKKVTRSVSVTNYAQHLDFNPSMLKWLKPEKGWTVDIAAYGLGKPRMMALGPNNELYITRRDGGDVMMLKDTNRDCRIDELTTVVGSFKGVHGIALKGVSMYLCNNNQLRRYMVNSDGTLSKEYEILIDDMPNGGQHSNRTMEFGPDGMLYLSIGSTCNDCKESDKEMATIVKIDTTTWKRKIFASGLRNTIGFDWQPYTKELWGVDNGGDAKGNNWPPEELNKIEKDGGYGFPLAYGKRNVDQSREDPAGDIKEEVVKNSKPSVLEFDAHMAPINLKFIKPMHNLPPDFTGDALVSWHGSWNRRNPKGFKVQRIHYEGGNAVKVTDFLKGFLRTYQGRKARFGRPAGIAISTDGIVYISDDANGVIYAMRPIKK